MTYKLKIITPNKKIFEDEIDSFTASTEEGSLTILANHSPIICLIKEGVIKINNQSFMKSFLIKEESLLKFKDNKLILLTADIMLL